MRGEKDVDAEERKDGIEIGLLCSLLWMSRRTRVTVRFLLKQRM